MSDFLPADLVEWLALGLELLVVTAAVLAFTWRAIRAPLVAEINGWGRRVKDCELTLAERSVIIQQMERDIHDSKRDRTEIHDRIGRIEGAVERVITALERNRDARMEEESEIKERLVRIETKVDLLMQDIHPK